MQSSSQARTLVHSLIQLGAALGIATVAEGIEEVAQLRHLQDEECLFGQGYLLSLPLDREELPLYLAGSRESVGTRPTGGTPT
jgi:EAL domain-containing protein (putative c-di-GMP-specific phosphodiesterase class I)